MKIFVSVPKGNMTIDEFIKAREAAKVDAIKKAFPEEKKESKGTSLAVIVPDTVQTADTEEKPKKKEKPKADFCDSFLEDFESDDLKQLISKNISMIASADAAYFGDGWKKCAGAKAEHFFCDQMGINILKD